MLIITGPTGVGKTDTSIKLAKRLNGEIISADSVQVYRGLDVGSDKIAVQDRAGALFVQFLLQHVNCLICSLLLWNFGHHRS